MKKLRVSSAGLLLIVAVAAGGGIFLLDMCHLQPHLEQHEQARLRERAGAAQVTTQFALHVEEDRLVSLCRAWRRDATIRGILTGATSSEDFHSFTQEIADYQGEHIWVTDSQGRVLMDCHPDCDGLYTCPEQGLDHSETSRGNDTRLRGVMPLGNTVAVFASSRIYTRHGDPHTVGRLWIARQLDEAMLDEAASAIDGKLVFIPAKEMPAGARQDAAAVHASWTGADGRLMVVWPANDIDGNMVGYFRADVPVTSIGRQTATIRRLVLGILILAAGVTLLLITGVHILVAGPIVRLLKRLRLLESGHITASDLSHNLHAESRVLADELEAAFNRLATSSQTDPLTGLANRGHFEAVLDKAYHQAVRYDRPLTVMTIDVDFFKAINDTYGHQAGDAALIALAEALKTSCRRADLAGRVGGDEFCILMPETGALAAQVVAQRLRDMMGHHHDSPADGPDKLLTLSIGIASVPADNVEAPDQLLNLADQALYVAKARGRDQFVVANDLADPAEPALAATDAT